MSEVIKFEQQEVDTINELRENLSTIYTQLGQLKIEKERKLNELESLETQLIQQHIEIKEKEKTFFENLTKKYGDGEYDINTNVFTPTNNPQTKG